MGFVGTREIISDVDLAYACVSYAMYNNPLHRVHDYRIVVLVFALCMNCVSHSSGKVSKQLIIRVFPKGRFGVGAMVSRNLRICV
jgi:hypothetical protein